MVQARIQHQCGFTLVTRCVFDLYYKTTSTSLISMSYEEEIESWRKDRETDLREGVMIGDMRWSPVPEDERKDLKQHSDSKLN